jgi:hypothetical protein
MKLRGFYLIGDLELEVFWFFFSSSSIPPFKLCGIDFDGIYWVC